MSIEIWDEAGAIDYEALLRKCSGTSGDGGQMTSNAVRSGRGKCSHDVPLKEHCVKCAELFDDVGTTFRRLMTRRSSKEAQ